MLGRGSVYTVLNYDYMYVTFVRLYNVSWFHSHTQGYGSALY